MFFIELASHLFVGAAAADAQLIPNVSREAGRLDNNLDDSWTGGRGFARRGGGAAVKKPTWSSERDDAYVRGDLKEIQGELQETSSSQL